MDKNTLLLEKTAENLIKNGFKNTLICNNIEETKKLVKSIIKPKTKLGIGGSMTVKELDLVNELKENEILQHQQGMSLEERKQLWRKIFYADYYLASPQAITQDGKMFFLDMYGNRVSAIIFGPEHVILLAGYNKIVNDEQTALWRIRNISAVKNVNRLKKNTPCYKTGKCENCNSNDRICRVLSVIYKKPPATEYTVILINHELGF